MPHTLTVAIFYYSWTLGGYVVHNYNELCWVVLSSLNCRIIWLRDMKVVSGGIFICGQVMPSFFIKLNYTRRPTVDKTTREPPHPSASTGSPTMIWHIFQVPCELRHPCHQSHFLLSEKNLPTIHINQLLLPHTQYPIHIYRRIKWKTWNSNILDKEQEPQAHHRL